MRGEIKKEEAAMISSRKSVNRRASGLLNGLSGFRNEILVKSRLLGNMNLMSALLIPQLSDPLPKLGADVPLLDSVSQHFELRRISSRTL
jgi:hypothetical protein